LFARLSRLGPASLLVALAAGLLIVFSLSRAGLALLYWARLRDLPGVLELIPLGLRFDGMTVAVALVPPGLALLVLPSGGLRRLRWAFGLYAAGLMALALFFELASVGFLDEYDSRPNRLFLEYLHKSDELSSTIWKVYPLLVV